MSVFRFKQFEVRNEKSAMKVNTDGVLLGAASPIPCQCRKVLDIGTGTGTIALMIAQRLFAERKTGDGTSPEIIGIDIDKDAACEADFNFSHSPWAAALTCIRMGLAGLDDGGQPAEFDLIVSNPPYYDDSLTNPDEKKTTARHTGGDDGLSFREVLDFARRHLSPEGIVSVVLPADQEMMLLRHGRMNGLYLAKILRIKTVERKKPSRIIAAFSREKVNAEEASLIMMEKGKYTDEYLSLVKDFYLFA